MKWYSSNQMEVCYSILLCVVLAAIWYTLERSLERPDKHKIASWISILAG